MFQQKEAITDSPQQKRDSPLQKLEAAVAGEGASEEMADSSFLQLLLHPGAGDEEDEDCGDDDCGTDGASKAVAEKDKNVADKGDAADKGDDTPKGDADHKDEADKGEENTPNKNDAHKEEADKGDADKGDDTPKDGADKAGGAKKGDANKGDADHDADAEEDDAEEHAAPKDDTEEEDSPAEPKSSALTGDKRDPLWAPALLVELTDTGQLAAVPGVVPYNLGRLRIRADQLARQLRMQQVSEVVSAKLVKARKMKDEAR